MILVSIPPGKRIFFLFPRRFCLLSLILYNYCVTIRMRYLVIFLMQRIAAFNSKLSKSTLCFNIWHSKRVSSRQMIHGRMKIPVWTWINQFISQNISALDQEGSFWEIQCLKQDSEPCYTSRWTQCFMWENVC